MATVGLATVIPQGRGGEHMEAGRKRFLITYKVVTDSPSDGPHAVLSCGGLPAMRDPYPVHPSAVVVGRYPRPVDGTRLLWHVEIEYDTHSIDRDDDPLKTRPEIEWGFEPFDEPIPGTARPAAIYPPPEASTDSSDTTGSTKYIQLDNRYGAGILNAAGDPFDPPATHQNYYPVVRYTRNEISFSPLYAILYGNTVNLSAWNGLTARQVWLKPIEASHEVRLADGLDSPDVLYWRVRYTFVLKAQTWDLAVLNQGPNYLDQPNTSKPGDTPASGGAAYTSYPKKYPFLRDGHPVTDLLKPDGTRFSKTEQKVPSWIIKRVKREVPFDPLNIKLDLNLTDLRRLRVA